MWFNNDLNTRVLKINYFHDYTEIYILLTQIVQCSDGTMGSMIA